MNALLNGNTLPRILVGFGLLLVTMMVTSSHALAQDGPIEVFDSTTGYDHVNQPPEGAFSSADWCLSFTDYSLVGQTIEITATGPSGTVTGSGVVGDQASVRVRVGITEGGTYSITSIEAPGSGRQVDAGDVGSVDVVFDPDIVDCLDGLSIAAPPTVVSTTTTTTTTTTIAPTTTAATPATTAPPETESAGSSTGWWILFGGGLGLLIVGLLMTFFPDVTLGTTDRCTREREALKKEEAERNKAKKAVDEAVDQLAENKRKSEEHEDLMRRGRGGKTGPARERELIREQTRLVFTKNIAVENLRKAEELVKKARAALEACEKRPRSGGTTSPGPATGGEPGGGTTPPSDNTMKKVESTCCPSGNWFGFNAYTGLMVGVFGWESGIIVMRCADDGTKVGMYRWSGLRVGGGLGAEISGSVVGIYGSDAVHPQQLIIPLRKTLSGIDFDFSLGLGWTKFVKTGFRAIRAGAGLAGAMESMKEARSVVKAIKAAQKAGDVEEVARLGAENADIARDLMNATNTASALEEGSKSVSSAGQASGVGLQLPVGVGVQLGVWSLRMVTVECVSWSGCESCDPEKYLTGLPQGR